MNSVSIDPELAPDVINLLNERLKSLKQENERLKAENRNLRVVHGQASILDMEERDTEACARQSCASANEVKVLREKLEAQDDLQQQVHALREEVSTSKEKYKRQKTTLEESQSIRAEIEAQLHNCSEEKIAAEKARAEMSEQLQVITREYEGSKVGTHEQQLQDFKKFLARHPRVDAPHWTRNVLPFSDPNFCIRPIYRDTRAPDGILYFPERTILCSVESRSYMIVAPSYRCRPHKPKEVIKWARNDELSLLVGQTRELLIKSKKKLYYVGTYKCLDGPGILMKQPCHGLDDEVVTTLARLAVLPSPTLKANMVRDLYDQGFATVDYLGLQCVGFNTKLFEALVATDAKGNNKNSKRKKGASKEADSEPDSSDGEGDSKKARVA